MREFEKFMLIDEKHIYLHFYSGCSFSDSVNPVKFFFSCHENIYENLFINLSSSSGKIINSQFYSSFVCKCILFSEIYFIKWSKFMCHLLFKLK